MNPSMVKDPTISQRDLALIGCQEHEIISKLPSRIHQAIDAIAHEFPNKTAILYQQQKISYATLHQWVEHTQQTLHQQGIGPGDRVVLINENCPELIVLLLSLSRLSAITILMNARMTAKERDLIIEQSDPKTVIYTSAVSQECDQHASQRQATPIHLTDLATIRIEPIKQTTPESVQQDGHDIAAMIFTTGTTGTPKGVMLSHYNLLFVAYVASKLRGMSCNDVVYGVLPIAHVYGLASQLIGTLINGATLCLYTRFDPKSCVFALTQQHVTSMLGVPAMYAKLIEYLRVNDIKLDALSLNFAYAGGSPIDPTVKQQAQELLGVPLHNGYGLTESSPSITQTRSYAPVDDVSVGYALPGVALCVKNPQNPQQTMPIGEVGELWAKGPNIMRGYFRAPDKTQEVLQDGWLNTGDLAYINASGKVYIVGRTKELIIHSGFNVYPPEIEAVLNAFAGITLSAVVGITRDDANEDIIAFIEIAPGAIIDLDKLNTHLRQQLAPYKQPAHIKILDQLPASATGKPLKAQLKTLACELFG